MSEAKHPGIKLLGKTIQLAPEDDVSHALKVVVVDCEETSGDQNSSNNNNNSLSCSNDSVSPTSLFNKNSASGEGSTDSKQEDGCLSAVLEKQTLCEDKESSSSKASKKEEAESETSRSQDKPLQKPDKILPCPRCNSMDTKFCYFNNYNVSQPRHFCKKCQRYWTAGGTMRNVPVGAGRRKTKTTSSSCSTPRYIVIPDTSNGSDSPLCESMTSALTIDEKSSNSTRVSPVLEQPRGPYFPAPPWPSPWNSVPFPVPIFCGVPASWIQQPCATTEFSNTSSGPTSPLGKHPREGAMSNEVQVGEEKRAESKVLVPKTLRFDDPSEAAKSSIWTTLGIKNENTRSLDSGVFFRGLQSKGGQMSAGSEMSLVLQANPAALSRSMTYRESVE